MRKQSPSSAVLRKRRHQLVRGLPPIEQIVRGSLMETYKRCGRPNCHCAHQRANRRRISGPEGVGPHALDGRDEFFSTLNGVSFLMEDGNVEVRCRAVREMLRDRFGSDRDEADAEAFKANREEIERAASDKYDAGKFEVGTDVLMVVTGYDMASPLSQKI